MGKQKINYLRMEPASNGVVVSWEEKTETPVHGQTYCNSSYKERKEVFEFDADHDTGGDGMDKAMNRYRELMLQYSKEKS